MLVREFSEKVVMKLQQEFSEASDLVRLQIRLERLAG
jgi:hypothetical protein